MHEVIQNRTSTTSNQKRPPSSRTTAAREHGQSANGTEAIESDTRSFTNPINPEGDLSESAAELCKSRGYSLIRNPLVGVDMAIYRFIDISPRRTLADIVFFKFLSGDDSIKINEDEKGTIQAVEGANDDLGALCRELTEKTEKIVSSLRPNQVNPTQDRRDVGIPILMQELQSHSINLLIRKHKYYKVDDKNTYFWLTPVVLTSSRLHNSHGDDKSWIPLHGNSGQPAVDMVFAANLAPYLDFSGKVATVLGRDSFGGEPLLENLVGKLGLFRLVTLLAAFTLAGAFFLYAGSGGRSELPAYFSFVLAAFLELSAGWRLIKSYRRFSRGCAVTSYGSWKAAPDQIITHEKEFSPSELSYLYLKYGGAELPRMRKGLREERISELAQKAKRFLGKARKFQNAGLYSESVLAFDQAARSALAGTLLSTGVEVKGRDSIGWIHTLRMILPDARLEDVTNLWTLRDRVNRGHDATKNEARRSEIVAETITGQALKHIRANSRGKPDDPRRLDESCAVLHTRREATSPKPSS